MTWKVKQMIDRVKVIEGLEYLDTAYAFHGDDGQCIGDALELLKARVLTPEELKAYNGYCWLEEKNSMVMSVSLIKDGLLSLLSDFDDPPYDVEKLNWLDYGKDWRCWSTQPTEEQRKAVKWDDKN